MAQNTNPIRYSDLVSPDNSIDELVKKLENLSDTYRGALRDIRTEAAALAKTLDAVSGATEAGRNATKKASDDAEKLARAERDLAFAESETAKKLAELKAATKEQNDINKLMLKINQSAESSYNRLSAQYSLNKLYINNMTKAERENTEEGRKLVAQTKEIYEEMKRLQEATGKTNLNVGNYREASDAIISYGDSLKANLGLNNKFGDALLALGQGGETAKSAFRAIGDGSKALGKTLMGLLSNPVFLGIAGIAAAGAAFKWWYDYNAGLVEATRLTQQFTGKEGDDLKAFRNHVQAIADTFDVDFKETLMASNAVAKQFGISGEEALQLIQDGFVAGANANGEFIDTLKEYPAYFKEAGISADQFVAIVAQTNKAGIFSDKGVDAIKEANIRLREMTTSTADALDAIGISSTEVQQSLQDGTKTTFQVMQEVSARLNEFPDSATEVGTALADIFGGPGEDAGLQYIRTLKDVSTNLDDVKAQAGILGQLQEQQLNAQLDLQNALAGLFDATGGSFETMTTRAKVFFTEGLAKIINGAISIVNYIIELYNESLAVRVVWNGLVVGWKNAVDTIGNLFNLLVDVFKAGGTIIKGVFTLDFDTIKQGYKEYAESFKTLVENQVSDMKSNYQEAYEGLTKKVKPITIPITTKAAGASPGQASTGIEGKVANIDKDEQKKLEEAYKKNLALLRKLQDAQLAVEADAWERRTKQIEYQYDRQIEDYKHQLETEQGLTKENQEAINGIIKALAVKRGNELLSIEREKQQAELDITQKGIELRLQSVKEGTDEERRLRLELLELQKQSALLMNAQLPGGQQQDAGVISASFDKKAKDANEAYIQGRLNEFDKLQALAQSEFDLVTSTEEKKTQFRLRAERDRLQKVIDLNKEMGGKLTEVEVATMQNTITKINEEIANSERDERNKDIYSMLGINLTDEAKDAINQSMAFALDSINQLLDAKAASAERAVQDADKEVDAAQRALEAEREARANGYASNVEYAQKELEAAKKNQQAALNEQKKIQRQQMALQTVTQAANLVTASTEIWASLGKFPPLAIAAIALMWSSFAASKIKALQLTKGGTEEYGEGTVELLRGGSHASGNDIDLGTTPDGRRRRAEGGEFFAVINKRNSARYRSVIPDVINSLNSGTFAEKYMNVYPETSTAVTVAPVGTDLGTLQDDVREIRAQNERRYVQTPGGTVMYYKNLKQIIKN